MKGETRQPLYDVVAVNLTRTDRPKGTVRFMDHDKTYENAEAVERFAIMRRGVGEEFFSIVPAGTYNEGDKFEGNKMPHRDSTLEVNRRRGTKTQRNA